MPGVVRLGDICSGHGNCPPRPNNLASTNVFVNGLGVHRLSDTWDVHCDHTGITVEASTNVFVNGLGVARQGDTIDCGSVCDECSSDVFVN